MKLTGKEMNYMTAEGKEFVDTNIFVYAYNSTNKIKQAAAANLLIHLWESRNGCLSIQVMQEFYVTVVQKIANPLSFEAASQIIADLSNWHHHIPETNDVLEAIKIHKRNQISFWDAMIVNSAKKMNCKMIWTEDLNHNQTYEEIKVINPFSE